MIDCVLKFASETAAKTALASEVATRADGTKDWLLDHILAPTVWRASQDTLGPVDPITGIAPVIHTPLTGFFVLVSLPDVRPALIAATQVQFAVDRDLALTRDRAALIKNNLTLAVMNDIRMSPIFAGMDWPWGAWA